MPVHSLTSVKLAAVLNGKGPIGGGGGLWVPGFPGSDPQLGGPYTRKKFFRTQVQIHIQRPQHTKKF